MAETGIQETRIQSDNENIKESMEKERITKAKSKKNRYFFPQTARMHGKGIFDENNCFLLNIEDLKKAAADDVVAVLTEVERKCLVEGIALETRGGNDLAAELLALADLPDWRIRGKALITIGRIGGEALSDPVIAWLKKQKEPCWQLQALDCWQQLPVAASKKAAVLADLTKWADQPVTVRALVWLLKELATPQAAEIFVDFALNKKTMMVKDEFMTDAWFELAAKLPVDLPGKIAISNDKFRIWLNFRYPEEKNSHYSLYPSPDYLWQCAAEEGVDRKAFKKLYFKPRKKI